MSSVSAHLGPYPALTGSIGQIDLSSKSILITGGGYGLGTSIATSFAQHGPSHIILIGRSPAPLEETITYLRTSFPRVTFEAHTADISSEGDIARVFGHIDRRLDILVNNAAYMPKIERLLDQDADLEHLKLGLLTNVYGTALVTQSFLRHRQARVDPIPPQPAIVLTLNTAAAFSIRHPGTAAYASTKASLARWCELAAVDVPESVARFVSVHPGLIKTQMAAHFGFGSDFKGYTDGSLVGDFLVWLTGEQAAFLGGRFVYAKWDIEDLLSKKEKIVGRDLLRTHLSGIEEFA